VVCQGAAALRAKANRARRLRCRTLICVLEEPSDPGNVGAIVRSIDALGVGKLYVVCARGTAADGRRRRPRSVRSTADRWVYMRQFATTSECLQHLRTKGFASIATSPPQAGRVNLPLSTADFTRYAKLAVWFGNESRGISTEALQASNGCVQIEMCGVVESLNLSVSAGIVLHAIAAQRRAYTGQRRTRGANRPPVTPLLHGGRADEVHGSSADTKCNTAAKCSGRASSAAVSLQCTDSKSSSDHGASPSLDKRIATPVQGRHATSDVGVDLLLPWRAQEVAACKSPIPLLTARPPAKAIKPQPRWPIM
jgi:tRNA (guanosine-2'-O-)-methyltransferase